LNDQGIGFPYTKGMWIVSQLVGAINPHDLDALDDSLPFTKDTIDNLLGRIHTPVEYQMYFERNPNAVIYADVYRYFLNDKRFARDIILPQDQHNRESRAGYVDGKRPNRAIPSISHLLAPHTAAAMNASGPPPPYDPSNSHPPAGPPPAFGQVGGPPPPPYNGSANGAPPPYAP
jgi:hypothetical protein